MLGKGIHAQLRFLREFSNSQNLLSFYRCETSLEAFISALYGTLQSVSVLGTRFVYFRGMQAVPSSHHAIERRLLRATQYVQKQWLPVNKPLLTRIRVGLKKGVYELDSAFLIEELKLDQGLLLSCIRAACVVLKDDLVEQADGMEPIALLELAGYERLKSILEDDFFFNTAHDLSSMSEVQCARMKESLVSVGAIQTLTKGLKEHAHVGYSAALLRQLGLNLIAWNYPTVFSEALSMEQCSLEDALIELLGFSPQALAYRIIHSWNMPSQVTRLVADTDAIVEHSSEVDDEIIRLCEVGETLARACNPLVNAAQDEEWLLAKDVIFDVLGEFGLREIQHQVTENAREYLDSFPNSFDDLKKLNPDSSVAVQTVLEEEAHEEHPSSVKTFEKAVLQSVYDHIAAGEEKLALATLVQQAIPKLGFTGGGIFILDPLSKKLIRRVKIGASGHSLPEVISIEDTALEDSPIVAGFFCSAPMIENTLDPSRGYMTVVSSVLGKSRRAGVLYLEKQDISASAGNQLLVSFKAVQQAFCDCLKLR